MTTIVYRNGVLAGDTRTMYRDTPEQAVTRKVRKSRDGRLVGGAGVASVVQAYADALVTGKPRPVLGDGDGLVIEVLQSREVRVHQKGGMVSLGKLKYGAWGSGSEVARGALMMGASAEKAVRIAARGDVYTGGPVRKVRL